MSMNSIFKFKQHTIHITEDQKNITTRCDILQPPHKHETSAVVSSILLCLITKYKDIQQTNDQSMKKLFFTAA